MHRAISTIIGRLVGFWLLSALDLLLTWRLVHNGGSVYESNPVARWFLHAGGWAGIAAFKAAVVVTVSAAIIGVARLRPRLGRALATLSCVLVGGVVLYSAALPRVYGVLPNGLTAEEEAQVVRKEALEEEKLRMRAHQALKDRLVADVVYHRRTLTEVADLLLDSERYLPRRRLEYVRWLYPGRSDRAAIAASFAGYAVVHYRANPSFARHLWDELDEAYRVAFGEPVPIGRTGANSIIDIIESDTRRHARAL